MRLLLPLALALSTFGAEIGDPAPPLKVSKWAKGGPVVLDEGKGKTVYVVDFWATDCTGSREVIPRLNDLQKKFKDQGVVLIGICNEGMDVVKPFLEEMGDKMQYAVALDDDEATFNAWLEPFHVEEIPETFLVDKTGLVLWHGDPTHGLEAVLTQLLAGKFDLETAKKVAQAKKLEQQYLESAREGAEPAKLKELGKQLLEAAAMDKDLLNEFAWTMLSDDDIRDRDLELVLAAAKAAFDLSDGKEWEILDTYAHALYLNGRSKEAIEQEKKALELCKDDDSKKEMQKSLDEFQGKKDDGESK